MFIYRSSIDGKQVKNILKMNIDTELLISEVEGRRNLWDVGDEYYKDRDIRMASWQDIGKTVVQNFENMSEIEKKKAGKL